MGYEPHPDGHLVRLPALGAAGRGPPPLCPGGIPGSRGTDGTFSAHPLRVLRRGREPDGFGNAELYAAGVAVRQHGRPVPLPDAIPRQLWLSPVRLGLPCQRQPQPPDPPRGPPGQPLPCGGYGAAGLRAGPGEALGRGAFLRGGADRVLQALPGYAAIRPALPPVRR